MGTIRMGIPTHGLWSLRGSEGDTMSEILGIPKSSFPATGTKPRRHQPSLPSIPIGLAPFLPRIAHMFSQKRSRTPSRAQTQ